MKHKKCLLIFTVSVLLLAPVIGAFTASAQTSTKPDSILFVTEPSADTGITKLENKELDIFAYSIANSSLLQRVEDDPELDYFWSYGSYNELTFNPAGPEFNTGKLNPFAVPKIREAMNYLIDRDYVTQTVMGGLATPRWTALNTVSNDAALLADAVRSIELKYAYNKQLAKQIIDGEMLSLGAVLTSGKWHYHGDPVEISVLIRIEDERLMLGDYVADQLEDIGFQVIRDYKAAADASPIWIGSDPNDGLFHIYTAGWITKVIPRNLADNFAFFYTDMGLPYLLWQAYVNDPEFYELARRLNNNDYATSEERQAMMKRALELSMEDSVRIFLNDRKSFTPKQANISLAADLYGGINVSQLWAKTLQRTAGDTSPVTIGLPVISQDPWNPISGTNWVYDMMPIQGTADYATVSDPYTGLNWPDRIERAEVVIREGLPVFKTLDWVDLSFAPEIVVPGDAWGDWDAAAQRFIRVDELHPGETVTAHRKSTVYYPEGLYTTVKWHDGSPFSIADILMNMILTFDRGQEESDIYDESAAPNYNGFMSIFKGVKIISEDPLVIETYMDQYNSDAELSVTTWWPYYAQGQGSWHALNLGIRSEAAGEAAFSSSKATDTGVPWLDFTTGPTVTLLKNQLDAWQVDKAIPYATTLNNYITTEELNTRLDNIGTWYNQYSHFWIGTGPYFLASIDKTQGELALQRFTAHPDLDDRWAAFAQPPIPTVQVIGPDTIELGGEAVYGIYVTQGEETGTGLLNLQANEGRSGEPYPSQDIELVGFLLVGQNKVYLSGEAAYVGEGHYQVVVDRETVQILPGGAVSLEVVVVSKRIALPSSSGVSIDNQNYTIFLPLTVR
jgi:peptide/nickel transport system substrate-binding protein